MPRSRHPATGNDCTCVRTNVDLRPPRGCRYARPHKANRERLTLRRCEPIPRNRPRPCVSIWIPTKTPVCENTRMPDRVRRVPVEDRLTGKRLWVEIGLGNFWPDDVTFPFLPRISLARRTRRPARISTIRPPNPDKFRTSHYIYTTRLSGLAAARSRKVRRRSCTVALIARPHR